MWSHHKHLFNNEVDILGDKLSLQIKYKFCRTGHFRTYRFALFDLRQCWGQLNCMLRAETSLIYWSGIANHFNSAVLTTFQTTVAYYWMLCTDPHHTLFSCTTNPVHPLDLLDQANDNCSTVLVFLFLFNVVCVSLIWLFTCYISKWFFYYSVIMLYYYIIVWPYIECFGTTPSIMFYPIIKYLLLFAW